MELSAKQMEAVELILSGSFRIVAVTGAAGTGKTTIIKEVVRRLREDGKIIAICAPTGKAARRITEATEEKAVTIHKLLEYPKPGERDPETGRPLDQGVPKRGYNYPLVAEVVIADEYAMVNHELNRNLIDALRSGAQLVVVGDVNQLPPIEQHEIRSTGDTPFQALLKSKAITLDKVFRQDEDAGILVSADQIRRGVMPKQFDDFKIAQVTNHVEALRKYLIRARDGGVDFSSLDYQVITPDKKSWVGTAALNRMMQDLFNGDRVIEEGYTLQRHKWDANEIQVAVGDKVVCTENMYDLRPYPDRFTELNDEDVGRLADFIETPSSATILNGEIGIITAIHLDGTIEIDVGDRIVEMPVSYDEYNPKYDSYYKVYPQKSIDLAYALTTHKCQGSEFKRIVYVTAKRQAFMLNRKNFYTAVTRAKEHVLVITDPAAIRYSLKEFKQWVPKKPKMEVK